MNTALLVVLKTMASCSGVSTDAEFFKLLNEKISETDRDYVEKGLYIRVCDIQIQQELQMLEAQPLGRRRGKEHIAIWLWCKSNKTSCQVWKLAESDHLLKLIDILMAFFWSKSTQRVNDLFKSFPDTYSLQFLKTLSV